ncbi:DUF3916 domain-containing protein [Planococcus shixiaomingii]|uniref:DUF3916 domain-containing protein n=1 Tax=Planococcus shixiaomingii TaxID=3058393 RepID=UPI002615E46C|nr:DUF3916 domain-containing protein [Planococcus sp. N022]WKA55509.1 DUF3916 domain-containing protein [Planococcus sp. N022]
MREKKIRGIKRKTQQMIKAIEEETKVFPTEFYNGFWHLHLPVAQSFIDSKKTPKTVRRLCMQTLLNQGSHLQSFKPLDSKTYRVVVSINTPDIWNSQIIVFKGDSHFKDFFIRNNNDYKWIPLPENRNLISEWELTVASEVQLFGFKEIISDEEAEYYYEGEIWFIGDIE